MPSIRGVLETALYVEDLERSESFYQGLFGFSTMFKDQRIIAMNAGGAQVLLLIRKRGSTRPTRIPGGWVPPTDGDGELHVAFAIAADELPGWEDRLTARGIEIESRVRWDRGGVSLYFRDPDRHVLELATPGVWPNY